MPGMTHPKDISLSDIESGCNKTPRTTAPSTDDTPSISSEVTLTERISSSPLCAIAGIALSVPACSLTNLCLTLLGHLMIIIASPNNAHIRTVPMSSSIAAGAVGGAIWGGACLAAISIMYWFCGSERYDLPRLVTALAMASVIVSPLIGVAVVRGVFHGNILKPLMAMGASIIGTLAISCTTGVLLLLGALVIRK